MSHPRSNRRASALTASLEPFRVARRIEADDDLPRNVVGGAGGAGARTLPGTLEGGASEAEIQGFGMKIFLASLTMVFGGTFVAYIVIWIKNRATWDRVIDSSEIAGLAAATVLLVVADICAARALKSATTRAQAWSLTRASIIAALIYLGVQSLSWFPLIDRVNHRPGQNGLSIEGFLFLMLTFAHAVHVFGGIVANFIVLLRSRNGRGPHVGALRLLYQYWRFLTVVWVAVLVLLLAL